MDTQHNLPYVHRDISWLGFNYRVLQEAKDASLPLLERIKFLAIYSSNLDEFFRVRVAHHRNLIRVGKKTKKRLQLDPKTVLTRIQNIVNKQQQEYGQIFEEQIIPALKENGTDLLKPKELSDQQKEFVETYFQDNLLPYVQPVLLVQKKVRPFLNNATIYLCLNLREKGKPNADPEYALVQVPSRHFPRFIEMPPQKNHHDLIILDDVVRHNITWLFPGYDILNSYSIKLTRDAELYIDDEFSGDLVTKIKRSLIKRNVGPASRLVYDREMPAPMLNYLMDELDIGPLDLLPEGQYHNNFDFFKFPDFGQTHLKNSDLPSLPYLPLENTPSFFAKIREKDHIIMVPYHSYESVVRFFEEAALDPAVTHIKIIQYRVASDSRIMNALMNAVKAGKQVTAFIELKARFDEEANLRWGEILERAGVNVKYSFPGLKVHAKVALIRRIENGESQLYSYLSTGNFHEITAKIYSDFGVFTADSRLTIEVSRIFSFLETVHVPTQDFQHLLVGQFNLRRSLEHFINYEIEQAKEGKPAKIILKLNSLQDPNMIAKLYEASQAGVKVHLIVRGICSIIPGKKDISDNIRAISIVDRYLEHARIFIFHNSGNDRIYLSSADWMERNLSFRIETAFPVYDEDVRAQIMDIINIQFNDNVKSRMIHYKHTNRYRRKNMDMPFQSQIETYYYFKRLNEKYLQDQEALQAQSEFSE
jgi:polyphosphate kinase